MELIVTTTLPAFSGNFEAVKAQMLEGVKMYEIEVTEENVAEAKKMATELNKLSTVINKIKSDKVKEVSAPIDEFKAQVGELIDICQQSREKILAQVKVFEDKSRVLCKTMLNVELLAQLDEKGIRPEFRNIDISPLVGLSALTKAGALTKAAKEGITAKVAEARNLQDRVDMRLLQLETACLKAGLKAPLTHKHVEGFITASDEQYEAQLGQLIRLEISRQTEIESRYAAQQNTPASLPPPMPIAQPVQAPAPLPIPKAAVWNQERLGQMRSIVGDAVFFQIFHYQPISEQALLTAATNPDLKAALEWARGES